MNGTFAAGPRAALARAVPLAVACLLVGCSAGGTVNPATREPGPTASVGLELSRVEGWTGDTLMVAIAAHADGGDPLAGIEGQIQFDPTRLRFESAAAPSPAVAMVNDITADRGMVRVASVAGGGLPAHALVARFRLLRQGPVASLRYLALSTVTRRGVEVSAVRLSPTARTAGLQLPLRPAALALQLATISAALATTGTRVYGDVNADGRVDVRDLVRIMEGAVGLIPVVGDAFVAANVAPANGGPAAGGRLPGVEGDGGRGLSVLDAVMVSNTIVGFPSVVVGAAIPAAAIGPRNVVTPVRPRVATLSDECRAQVATGTPFTDPSSGLTVPACTDGIGLPMVLQLCGYQKLADGTWLPDDKTAAAPRCIYELQIVQRGGV